MKIMREGREENVERELVVLFQMQIRTQNDKTFATKSHRRTYAI